MKSAMKSELKKTHLHTVILLMFLNLNAMYQYANVHEKEFRKRYTSKYASFYSTTN